MPKIEMDLPEPPDGYEYTGEYRKPKRGEYVLERPGDVYGPIDEDFQRDQHLILRKKAPRVLWVMVHKSGRRGYVFDSLAEAESDRAGCTYPESWRIVRFVESEESKGASHA